MNNDNVDESVNFVIRKPKETHTSETDYPSKMGEVIHEIKKDGFYVSTNTEGIRAFFQKHVGVLREYPTMHQRKGTGIVNVSLRRWEEDAFIPGVYGDIVAAVVLDYDFVPWKTITPKPLVISRFAVSPACRTVTDVELIHIFMCRVRMLFGPDQIVVVRSSADDGDIGMLWQECGWFYGHRPRKDTTGVRIRSRGSVESIGGKAFTREWTYIHGMKTNSIFKCDEHSSTRSPRKIMDMHPGLEVENIRTNGYHLYWTPLGDKAKRKAWLSDRLKILPYPSPFVANS